MSDIFRKIQSGISIRTLSTSPAPSVKGDLNVETTSGDLQYYNGTTLAHVATTSNTATFTNKTLDASLNTLSNIVNANISASAAITYSKLALSGAILNSDLAGSIDYSKLVLTGSVLNADLAGSIAYSKLVLSASIQNSDLATMPTHTIKGNITSGTAAPADLTYSQVNVALGTITALTGDVSATGTGGSVAATVNSVGGSTSTNIHSAEVAVNTNATASPTGSTLLKRDSNGNAALNNFSLSAGTQSANFTLTAASPYTTVTNGPNSSMTGTLPDATTLRVGQSFEFINGISGILTINNNGGSAITKLQAVNAVNSAVNGHSIVTCTDNSTANGTWRYYFVGYQPPLNVRCTGSSSSLTSSSTVLICTSTSYSGIGTSPYSTSTGLFTAPVQGYFNVSAQVGMSATFSANNTCSLQVYKNGSQTNPFTVVNTFSGQTLAQPTYNDTIFCNAGDTLGLYVSCGGTSPSFSNTLLNITQVVGQYV